MPLFQYHSDDADGSGKRAYSHSNGHARPQQAGSSKRPLIEDEGEEDYDMQAALEIERQEQGYDDDWEPHDHLYASNGFPEASTSRATSVTAQAQSARRPSASKTKPQNSRSNGKAREVLTIDNDDEEDDDMEMIPVPIDGEGAIVSNARIEQLSKEIKSIDEQIASLREAREVLAQDRQSLLNEQRAAQAHLRQKQTQVKYTKPVSSPKSIDYSDSSQFSWKKKLDGLLDRVFGIKKLRLCQEGVLNAVLDGRDVICIMPTGGGKSVCFQAPALLSKGVTLVISPLLSLMADQVLALNSKGVEAVMITGSTPQSEIKDITHSLTSSDGNIKLCYVTPEKLAKSKTFANTLGKMYAAGLLARIAIDESHCCSQMGHDFRPDYKQLAMLKQLFPKTPIIALTATCGKAVLNDVVKILHLKECTSGESAEPSKTVFFSAPLYRPNLHYSVRIKPVQAQSLAGEMADEILERYPNSSGIIYCLSQKETETFAQAIREYSEGKIKIGTYHAGMSDYDKENIHKRWREGRIKCVVATIAFGMGIDAPDVRYVFHQTISKSMEGYYQETGRAGRDGKDSDCILWFRPADASRLSSLTLREVEGQKKLHNMLKYALDLKSCRKLLFDSYFGNPANVVAPFAESDRSLCGHCDNCIRNQNSNEASSSTMGGATTKNGSEDNNKQQPQISSATLDYTRKQQIITRDVTLEAWKICKIIQAADSLHSRITLPGAGDLCRGLNKCTFPIVKSAHNKRGFGGGGNGGPDAPPSKASLDLDKVCNGKVTTLNKDDMEILLVELIIQGYLKEEFVQTAYSTNSYIVSGTSSIRLTRLTEEQVINQDGIKIELSTLGIVKPPNGKGRNGKQKEVEEQDGENGDDTETDGVEKTKKTKAVPRKRKSTKNTDAESTSDAPKPNSKGRKKAVQKEGSAEPKKRKPSSKSKDTGKKDDTVSEDPVPSKKRQKQKRSDSDSETEFEDVGLGRPAERRTSRKPTAAAMSLQENDEEDDLMDEAISDTHDYGMPDSEMSEEIDEDGFLVDRFNKKASKEMNMREKAASAALSRAGGGGGTYSEKGSTSASRTKKDNRQVIDLDSD